MQTRVLVIAPERDRDALIEWLQLAGFGAAGASSIDWRAEVGRFRPDALVIDIQPPDCDAAQLLLDLEQVSPPPRVILLSARPRQVYSGRGSTTCLVKPVDLLQLHLLLSQDATPKAAV